jgi:hypothetical protein
MSDHCSTTSFQITSRPLDTDAQSTAHEILL